MLDESNTKETGLFGAYCQLIDLTPQGFDWTASNQIVQITTYPNNSHEQMI